MLINKTKPRNQYYAGLERRPAERDGSEPWEFLAYTDIYQKTRQAASIRNIVGARCEWQTRRRCILCVWFRVSVFNFYDHYLMFFTFTQSYSFGFY